MRDGYAGRRVMIGDRLAERLADGHGARPDLGVDRVDKIGWIVLWQPFADLERAFGEGKGKRDSGGAFLGSWLPGFLPTTGQEVLGDHP